MPLAPFDVEDAHASSRDLTESGLCSSKPNIPVWKLLILLAFNAIIGFAIGWLAKPTEASAPEVCYKSGANSPSPSPGTAGGGGGATCEDLGHVLPEELRKELKRPLTEEEEQQFIHNTGSPNAEKFPADSSDPPVVQWHIGPSDAGKRVKAYQTLNNFNIPDPVVLDGDLFYDVHGGYQAVKYDGLGRGSGCVWRSALPALTTHRDEWLAKLTTMATEKKRNLVMSNVCAEAEKCLDQIKEFEDLGYVNDIVAIMANESVSDSFDESLASISPMIQSANGHFEILKGHAPLTPTVLKDCLEKGECPKEVIQVGHGGKASSSEFATIKAKTSMVNEIDTMVRSIEADQTGGAHLPLCKNFKRTLTKDQLDMLNQEYSESGLQAAREMSQVDVATSQERPLALFILGPAAVGKSKAIESSDLPGFIGLKVFKTGPLKDKWDAVILDGEFYRDVHEGFKKVVAEGLSGNPPCIWENAWENTAAQKLSKKEKNLIYEQAQTKKKNIIIPSSCASGFGGCMKKLDALKAAGYKTHVVIIHAKKSIIDSRGMSRADFKGKAYTSTYEDSVRAFSPMIAAVNGQWQFIDNTGYPTIIFTGEGWNLNRECALKTALLNPYLPWNQSMQALCPDALQVKKGSFVGLRNSNFPQTSLEILQHVDKIENLPWMEEHLPICESINIFASPDELALVNRDVLEEEYAEAERITGLKIASKQKSPIALWLLGPSAVGKSTAARGALETSGIKRIKADESSKPVPDVVNIDGEIFRSVHKGFSRLVEEGRKKPMPCIWDKGWKETKARSASKKFKKRVLDDAIQKRANLVIPSPCSSNLRGCIERVETLKKAGYVNHMIAIYARKALVDERGKSRADFDGKKYVTTVDDSIIAYGPMIAAGNGRYEFHDNSGRTRMIKTGACLNVSFTDHELELVDLGVKIDQNLRQFKQFHKSPSQVMPVAYAS